MTADKIPFTPYCRSGEWKDKIPAMESLTQKTSYVCQLTADQARTLQKYLTDHAWEIDTIPYALWRARKAKTSATAYESGKLVVQGKGTAELVQFVIEPTILKEARFGYELEQAEHVQPAMFQAHAGIDESGKGDYFGPLVIAAAYVDATTSRLLFKAGVQDSKAIKSEKRIRQLAELIRATTKGHYSVVTIGPEAYNRMYDKMANVNRILAWGHARALENLLEIVPTCSRAISDQFGRASTVLAALQEKGRKIQLEQRHKAEADIAVAAASILARDQFVSRLAQLGAALGKPLPKGASSLVVERATELLSASGPEELGKYAKLHFRTTAIAKAARRIPN